MSWDKGIFKLHLPPPPKKKHPIKHLKMLNSILFFPTFHFIGYQILYPISLSFVMGMKILNSGFKFPIHNHAENMEFHFPQFNVSKIFQIMFFIWIIWWSRKHLQKICKLVIYNLQLAGPSSNYLPSQVDQFTLKINLEQSPNTKIQNCSIHLTSLTAPNSCEIYITISLTTRLLSDSKVYWWQAWQWLWV